jgi:hypothetical protein
LDQAAGPARYRAFISYSHRDGAFAARLHRRLEGYVLPRRLGAVRRLTPIFKDREELSAAGDLSVQVRAALAVSDCLIVICSPAAAASPWVGREIETFRDLHPDRPVLAALLEGEPAEAFPPALSAGGLEPLAADFRKQGDGERLALLKLVAGMAGLGVDQLVQRDAQRRLRGVMAVTAASVAAMLAMGAMTILALSARAEADRQRAQAEGLVEFMLTDLRDRLQGVGRLDVLTTVNRRALAYYGGQSLDRLPPASLQRRALLLQAMGEDDTARGDLPAALGQFLEARRVTAALLAADPKNPDRIWAQAQSEYWVGYIAYLRRQPQPAKAAWRQYRTLSAELAERDPRNARFIRELAFAEGNLCSIAVDLEKDAAEALATCTRSLSLMAKAVRLAPEHPEWLLDLANRHAWLADALELTRDYAGAKRQRLSQEALLDAMLAKDPENLKLRENWTGAQRALGRIAYFQRDFAAARTRTQTVRATLTAMTRADPENQLWRDQLDKADRTLTLIDQTLKTRDRP